MKILKNLMLAVVTIVAFSLTVTASAQIGSPFAPAPSGALDTLSGASPGPGGPAGVGAVNRARDAAAGSSPFGGAPAPAAPAPAAPSAGGGGYYGDYYGGDYGYGGYGGGGAIVATPTPTPIPTEIVLVGQRVYDAVTKELLDDWRYVKIPQTERDQYFDTGPPNDLVANDIQFSDLDPDLTNVIGPQSHQVLARLLASLEASENMTPLEFFRLHVLTTETISEIGSWREEEAERDRTILDWAVRFVEEFKKNPDDPSSEFYSLYVVQPPPRPDIDVWVPTATWLPPTSPILKAQRKAEEEAEARGGYGGGGGGDYGGGGYY